MKLFRTGLSPHHTALAMIGAKPGSSVLVLGGSDPALAAEVALVTGLNGRTVVADAEAKTQTSVEAAAANAGALVDFAHVTANRVPFDADSFDIVIIQRELSTHEDARAQIVDDAVRVARGGGRVVVIEGERRSGLLASMARVAPSRISGDTITTLLDAAGLIAVRALAEAEGVVYAEGRKPAPRT